MIELTILGNIPSKSNSYKIITLPNRGAEKCKACGRRNGHSSLKKSTQMTDYEKRYQEQLTDAHRQDIGGPLTANIRVYYDSERPDTDGCLKAALDGLQPPKVKEGVPRVPGVILNDRQIRRIILERFTDRDNPRLDISLAEYVTVDEQLLFPPSNEDVRAWVDANAPEGIRAAINQLMEVAF